MKLNITGGMEMKKKGLKVIITSFIAINLLSTFPKTTMASTYSSSNDSLESSIYCIEANDDNKDDKREKLKGFSLFSEENYKYLSSDQKKDLLKLKKCKDSGEKLSPEQQQTLNSIADCIIKGKLGNKDYEDFKCLIEKKKANAQLTEKEEKKLKEYKDIIKGHKLSTREILNQFLRQ
jgi:hypothetical protein